jgi:hypothetical protein
MPYTGKRSEQTQTHRQIPSREDKLSTAMLTLAKVRTSADPAAASPLGATERVALSRRLP